MEVTKEVTRVLGYKPGYPASCAPQTRRRLKGGPSLLGIHWTGLDGTQSGDSVPRRMAGIIREGP